MAGKENKQDGKMHGYHILAVITMILMCFTACCLPLSGAAIYYPSIVAYLELPSVAMLSSYQTVMSIAMIIMLPFAGSIISKINVRYVLSFAALLIGLAFIAMSFFNAVWQWYVAGAVQGIGLAFCMYVAVPTIINRWFSKSIGFFIGLCLAFTGIGGIVFNQVAGFFIAGSAEGWRTGYMAYGIIVLVATIPFMLTILRNKPEDVGLLPYGGARTKSDRSQAIVATGVSVREAMKTPTFYLLALFAGLATFAAISLMLFPTYAGSLKGALPATAAAAATLMSLASAGQVLGKIGLGALSDKSLYVSLITATICGLCGFLIIWLLPSNVPVFLAGGFLFGIFFATNTVIPPVIARRTFGTKDYSNIWSRISMVAQICGALANVVWGVLAFGVFTEFFSVALLVVAAMFVCGLLTLKTGKSLAKKTANEVDEGTSVDAAKEAIS